MTDSPLPDVNDQDAQTLLSMGMNLGMYTISRLMANGHFTMTHEGWKEMSNTHIKQLEKLSGMSADTIAIWVEPHVREAIETIARLKREKGQ
jgi:hypothetical protein